MLYLKSNVVKQKKKTKQILRILTNSHAATQKGNDREDWNRQKWTLSDDVCQDTRLQYRLGNRGGVNVHKDLNPIEHNKYYKNKKQATLMEGLFNAGFRTIAIVNRR